MSTPSLSSTAVRPPLRRPRRVVLGGVCAALAEHLGRAPGSIRFFAVVATALGGGGALLYLWLWAFVPLRDVHEEPGVRRRVPVAALLAVAAGGAAIAVALALRRGDDGDVTRALAAAALFSGGAVAWSLGPDRGDPSRSARSSSFVRLASCAALVVAGAAVLAARPSAINAVLAVGVLLIAAGVLAAPRILTLWTELMGERAARVREEQRAEIAAHLHDSVLQTLALIQNRAGASSEVARIARAQERELRDWLFERDVPVANDLAAEVRAIAAAIELDYPAQLDVVAVGASVPGAASVLAATREAMLNAARHAGGEVSVYLESSAAGVDVFVHDRGPGVDLGAVPGERLGIRESIIGRMARAGGSATVRPGAGGSGTEVHVRLPAEAQR
ncbi:MULTISPECIES: PspC domain-containing protein [unclassified Rathayibacter]|uniref:PspC domain-containing protein n=1 Tax=unclassified Rathayibacter TaxID=2609250 RepID=UPI00188CB32C|nr:MULTISPECIES: ATP-binding protein [unclassified Rathayibacter]MBF4461016.1 PspC domain-containing protein [Rathayibacter sp. VKM Ac-2879]MBF4502427.1 PspC domain-containing protein [Rathayibacter sp. VKM Ac-2878]